MAADVVPYFRPQFLDANGKPLDGGKVYTYKAGTTTPIVTYADAAFTQNTNPIILDSSGAADIFIGIQSVKFVIYDKNDVLIKTVDRVTGANGSAVGIQTVVPITTNGVQTTFALGVEPEIVQNCTVVLKPTVGDRFTYLTSEYTLDGQNLTFNTAPPAGIGEVRVGHTRAIAGAGLSDGVVTTGKIQDLAVTNAKLADGSVGTGKIQNDAITKSKFNGGEIPKTWMVSLGQQVSASSGPFTTSSTSYVNVTNLSVTITTTGRPVWVGLMNDGTQGSVSIDHNADGIAPTLSLRKLRDATTISEQTLYLGSTNTLARRYDLPASSFWHVDTPSAGTYVYKIQVKTDSAAHTAGVSHAKLIAFEL